MNCGGFRRHRPHLPPPSTSILSKKTQDLHAGSRVAAITGLYALSLAVYGRVKIGEARQT